MFYHVLLHLNLYLYLQYHKLILQLLNLLCIRSRQVLYDYIRIFVYFQFMESRVQRTICNFCLTNIWKVYLRIEFLYFSILYWISGVKIKELFAFTFTINVLLGTVNFLTVSTRFSFIKVVISGRRGATILKRFQ